MFNTGVKKVKPNRTFYLQVHFKSILIEEDLKQVTTFYSDMPHEHKRTEPEQFPRYLDKTQRLPSVLKSKKLYRQPRERDKGHSF